MDYNLDDFFGEENTPSNDEYLQKSGVDLLTDPRAIADVRSYYEAKGQTFSTDKDMWDEFYSDRRWRDVNSVSMAGGAAEYALAGSSQELHSRLSRLWSQAPSRGGFFDKALDYGAAGVLDPLNLIGGAGVAKKAQTAYNAARAGMATSQQAIKAGTRAGAIQGAKTEAAINAGVGGGFDAFQQATEIQQGVSDEFSLGRLLGSAALDATVGGAVGGAMGAYSGKKAAESVTNWRETTAVGNDIARRASRLDADIATISDEFNTLADKGEDTSIISAQLADLQNERQAVQKLEGVFDDYDTKLDDLATRAQKSLADDPQADVKPLRDEYEQIMKERAGAFSRNVDEMVDELIPEPTPVATRSEASDAPEAIDQPSVQEAAQEAEPEAASATPEVPTETAEPTAPEAEVAQPAINYGKNKQVKKLVDDGKITEQEVQSLIDSGTLTTNKDGSIKSRYGEGGTATKKVQEYIKSRGSQPAPDKEATPAPQASKTEVPSVEQEQPKAQDAIAERPSESYDMLADEQFERIFSLGQVADGPWSVKTPRILSAIKKELEPQVFRRVKQRLDAVVELEKLGKNIPNAKAVADLRAQFLDREGNTTPDIMPKAEGQEPSTVRRSAGNTAKSEEVLRDGPVNAGRMDDGRVQGVLRQGFKTGSDDGRTVSKLSDVPDENLFGAQAARAQAEMDQKVGKMKSVYSYTASGRERKATIADSNSLEKGQIAYYVPHAKKFFKSKKNAEKAAGIRGDDNYEVVAEVAQQQEKPPVLTDEVYAREKAAIDQEFFNDESMTTGQYEAKIAELDARTSGVEPTETPRSAPVDVSTEALPDVPGKRGENILAAIPREGNKFKTARIISAKQISEGAGLNALLGKAPRDQWYIGYVDASMRNKKSNLEALKKSLDPYDETNSTGVEVNVEPELDVKQPLDTSSPEYKDPKAGIDLAKLTKEERMGLFLGIKMSDTITVLKGGKRVPVPEAVKLEDLKTGNLSMEQLDGFVNAADNFPMQGKITLNGEEFTPSEDYRTLALSTLFDLRNRVAPNGVRRSRQEVSESIEILNKSFNKISVKDREQIGRMFEMVADEKGMGPDFGAAAQRTDRVLGALENNKIVMANDTFTDTFGASPTFVAAHELGHWVYRNLMSDADIKEFWSAMRKQYADGKGMVSDASMEKFINRQPWGDTQGDFNRPNEYFANQFALYMHHMHDMVMWPNKSFWSKVTTLARKVFERMSGKSTYDKSLEPLFDKIITRQDEKARVAYANPVEPRTSLGSTLQARYTMLAEHALDATRRLDMDDIENFGFAMNRIADEFNSMATTEKGAKIIAAKKGEPYNASYTGVLEAIKPLAPRMRKAARLIKSVTGRYDQNINQSGADEITGTAFFADMEEDLKKMVSEEGLIDLVDTVLEKLNEVYQSVEFGDIPQYKVSRETADLRRRVGMDKITKSQTMKKSIRAFRAEKSRNKKTAERMIEEAKKKATPASDKVAKDTPEVNPNEVDLPTAAREFQRQIDDNGQLTKLGKALARRVAHILNTQDPMPKQRRTYSNLGNAELFLRYGQAVESGNADLINKLTYEIQARNKRPEIESGAVNFALEVERSSNAGVPSETGIPANSNYMVRNTLRAITHRTEPEMFAARTLAHRLALIGNEFSTNLKSDQFKDFRKQMRQLASNLTKNEDISQSVKALSKRIINSKAVPENAIQDLRMAAAELSYDADEFIARVVLEDVDTKAGNEFATGVIEELRAARGNEMDDAINAVRTNAREALSYLMNGLVPGKATRQRFSPLFVYGDMTGAVSRFDPASPSVRFTEKVPAEFAQDFAQDVVSQMSKGARDAVQRFTGKPELEVHFVQSTDDAMLDGMTFVTRRPSNTAFEKAGDIISQAEDKSKASELVSALSATRDAILEMRAAGDVSPNRIDAMYVREQVIRKDMERLGIADVSEVTPVFISDTRPLELNQNNTMKQPAIREVLSLIAEKGEPGMRTRANEVMDTLGLFNADQTFKMLSDAAGGARSLRNLLREAGYTSVSVNGRKAMLKQDYLKPIRSNMFVEAGKDAVNEAPSNINAHIVTEMSNRLDLGENAMNQASLALEIGGVRKTFVDAMAKVRRGQVVSEKEGVEIRKAFTHNILRSNAEIMRKSKMDYLAEFFQPRRGGGGHFERVAANIGKFVVPLSRMLDELPDSGGFIDRWLKDGVGQMYDATNSAGRRVMGMRPIHRSSQPVSHQSIRAALQNDKKVSSLTSAELKVYDYIRSYLDDAIGRLREIGIDPGVIKRNYFPQVWHKELIEGDQDRFVDLLTKYFRREAEVDGVQMTVESAKERAIKVKNRLISQDGVNAADVQNQYRVTADAEDNFDFQRQIRLDQFPEFNDPLKPGMNLGAFLETDLVAITTKYSDALEQRLDFQKKFGPKAIGYHDYLTVQSKGLDGVAKLLSTGRVISRDFAENLDDGTRVHTRPKDVLFHPPFAEQKQAETFVKELAGKARNGASAQQLQADIMARLKTDGETTETADRMRKNFSHRARAIANALRDSDGFLNKDGQIIQVSNENIKHAEGFFNAAMRKPVAQPGVVDLRATSKWLRSINAVTLLGFTTLSSMGDLILPLIRTGDFKATTEAWSKFMADPVSGSAYRDMIRNIGAASENIVHERMTKAFGVDNTRFTSGFFKTTLLTPWTQMNRDMAAAVGYEHFRAQARIAREAPNTKQGRVAKRILDQAGLSEVYRRNINLEYILRSNETGKEHPYREVLTSAIVKIANQSIFTPDPNDIPLFAQTPGGALLFQLKSFPLMMTRLGRDVIKEAIRKDGTARIAPLLYMAGVGPAFGTGVAFAKDVVQGRGGEDNREFAPRERALTDKFELAKELGLSKNADQLLGWYMDGLMQMGGLGLIGQMLYDTVEQADNGAYGQTRMADMIGGPSVGMFFDGVTVLGGALDATYDAFGAESTNAKERAAIRELISRVPVFGGVSAFREGSVDFLAGEAGN